MPYFFWAAHRDLINLIGKELGEALIRGAALMLAVEYDEDGIPKDLKPAEILAFLLKLEAYNL